MKDYILSSLLLFQIIFLSILLLSLSVEVAFAGKKMKDAMALRAIVKEIVAASAIEDKEQQAEEIRNILASNPVVFEWAIEGRDLNKIIKDADLPQIPEAAQEIMKWVQVTGEEINERLKMAKKNIEHLNKMKALMERNNVATNANTNTNVEVKEVEKDKIDLSENYRTTYRIILNKLLNFDFSIPKPTDVLKFEARNVVDYMVLKGVSDVNSLIKTFSKEDMLKILHKIPSSQFNSIANKINKGIDDFKIAESEEIKMMTNKDTGFDISALDPKMAILADIAIRGYFNELSLQDKRQLVISLMELPPQAPPLKKLSSILNNTGPAVQKLLQLVGNSVNSTQMKEVMDQLKSDIKHFDTKVATEIIEKAYKKPIDEIFKSFGPKPLAAASVGQVYSATDLDGNELIVKVMRPGIHEKARREMDLIKRLVPANEKGIQKIVDGLEESLFEELDFRVEADNLEKGQIYLKPKDGIYPIQGIEEFPATQNVFVMSKAPGKPISKVGLSDMAAKNRALANFLSMWMENALFGDGFFHGDLHGGNIFFTQDKNLTGKENKKNYRLTTIDFGNATVLKNIEQQAIIKMVIGGATSSSKLIIDAFVALASIPQKDLAVFSKYIEEVVKKNLSTSETINKAISKAIEMGLTIPKNFILFNRARSFLENQIEETTKTLDTIDPEKKYERFDPTNIYTKLIISKVGKESLKTMMGIYSSVEDYVPKVEGSTIKQVMKDFVKPTLIDYGKSCVKFIYQNAMGGLYDFLVDLDRFSNGGRSNLEGRSYINPYTGDRRW
ncbi:MAG: AarF/ABC1/UbiB kinase family protein [Oligoflexia bacterium]|nr:AarF/ABC1/UbiB kinase family protein [Oligoflexia bacterium]